MSNTEQDNLRERIAMEFNQFLLYTTIPAFFIIAVVVIALTLYAYCGISKRINELTKMVENPHKFKYNNILNNHSNKRTGQLLNGEKEDLDEIARLENIFAQFYNEEKVKGGQQKSTRENKKVSMLPMKTSINLFREDPSSNQISKSQEEDVYFTSRNMNKQETRDLKILLQKDWVRIQLEKDLGIYEESIADEDNTGQSDRVEGPPMSSQRLLINSNNVALSPAGIGSEFTP